MSEMPDTYLVLWEAGGSRLTVDAGDIHRIDAAVTAYLDTNRDSLLHLTTAAGEQYTTRASLITAWHLTTHQGRRRVAELEKADQDETRSLRLAVGLPWDDDG